MESITKGVDAVTQPHAESTKAARPVVTGITPTSVWGLGHYSYVYVPKRIAPSTIGAYISIL